MRTLYVAAGRALIEVCNVLQRFSRHEPLPLFSM